MRFGDQILVAQTTAGTAFVRPWRNLVANGVSTATLNTFRGFIVPVASGVSDASLVFLPYFTISADAVADATCAVTIPE